MLRIYIQALNRGEILPICHLNELILYFLSDIKRKGTACQVEFPGNYDIMGGNVYPCADLPQEWQTASIAETGSLGFTGRNLSRLTAYKYHLGCFNCGIHDYCGGRCPVQALTKGRDRLFQYCQLMRLHVAIVKSQISQIAMLLYEKNFSLQDLYDRSAFYT